MPTALRPKNIPITVAATLVISRSLGFLATAEAAVSLSQIGFFDVVYGGLRFFSVFLAITITHLLYIVLKHMTAFWWLILFFIDEVFVFRLESVKNTQTQM